MCLKVRSSTTENVTVPHKHNRDRCADEPPSPVYVLSQLSSVRHAKRIPPAAAPFHRGFHLLLFLPKLSSEKTSLSRPDAGFSSEGTLSFQCWQRTSPRLRTSTLPNDLCPLKATAHSPRFLCPSKKPAKFAGVPVTTEVGRLSPPTASDAAARKTQELKTVPPKDSNEVQRSPPRLVVSKSHS